MKLPTYSAYICMDDKERERLYHQYCKKNKLDPEIEYSVFEFFDTLDKKGNDETSSNSIDTDINSL